MCFPFGTKLYSIPEAREFGDPDSLSANACPWAAKHLHVMGSKFVHSCDGGTDRTRCFERYRTTWVEALKEANRRTQRQADNVRKRVEKDTARK